MFYFEFLKARMKYFKLIYNLNSLDVVLNLILKHHHSEHKYIPPSVFIWYSWDLVGCEEEILQLDRLE